MVVTRFAPSPTGDLHIGGVRTALYSWLHAKQHQGNFRLRIEDTDQERSTQSSVDVILDGMHWLGLDYQGEVIYQSQRFDIYNRIIDKMIADDLAYYCWCTTEELEAMREKQKLRGEKPRYNGKCRHDAPSASGPERTSVVRFKTPYDGEVSWVDKVRGKITIANHELDDFIIRRSDGTPTYNFCVVIDDNEQAISLVIRGDDHISNTPKQINLYEALGYTVPEFAHVPMILGDDGKRLSKRHGATNVLDYRREGYLPDAIINYLVRLGWAYGNQEIFSREELLELFRIDAVHSAPSAFNTEKLRWLNQQYLQRMSVKEIARLLPEYLLQAGYNIDNRILQEAIPYYQDRAKTLREMAEFMRWIVIDPADFPEALVKKAFKDKETTDILKYLASRLETLSSFDTASIHTVLENAVSFFGGNFGKVGQPARLALTGGTASPDLAVSFALAGKDVAVRRLLYAVEYLN